MNRGFAVFVGLCCCLPACVWAAGMLQASGGWHAARALGSAVEWVWILQAVAIAAFMPWTLRESDFRSGLATATLLILIALPVLTIAWLSDAVTAASLVKALAALLGWSLLNCVLAAAVSRRLPVAWRGFGFEPALGLALATFIWRSSKTWLSWLKA